MPKNGVQRLHKIENDLKTVISIFDVANKSNHDNGKLEKQKEENSKKVMKINSVKNFEEIKNQANCEQKSMLESFKINGNLTYRPFQNIQSLPVKKYWANKKPGSAPSSSSTLSTICETDYLWRPPTACETSLQANAERQLKLKSADVEALNSFDQFDLNNTPCTSQIFMTPSKTIEAANQILAKNDFPTGKAIHEHAFKPGFYSDFNLVEDQGYDHGDKFLSKNDMISNEINIINQENQNKFKLELNTKVTQTKEKESKKGIPSKIQSLTAKKENRIQKEEEGNTENLKLPTSKIVTISKIETLSKKEKLAREISQTRQNIFKWDKHRSENFDLKSTLKAYSDSKTSKDKLSKNWNTNGEGNVSQRNQSKSKLSSKVIEDSMEKNQDEAKTNPDNMTCNIKGKEEEKVGIEKKTFKPLETDDSEMGIEELFKIIERSNEKLEKMKQSKGLALDIAKQIKDEYEMIKQSKEELNVRLLKVEKDNERLNNEVKDAHQSTRTLQLKLQELRNNSKTVLQEQDIKNKEIISENAWLKAKISDLEKQCNEELQEKERLMESKIELLKRENRTNEEIQNLIEEKSGLKAKVEQLHLFLQDRNTNIEKLEEKIRQLHAEMQRQKHHLKQKTERLDDTNKELESIRQNSQDLEEQVKMLRKNIENFDQMHKNLAQRTIDYENQIQSQQEELKKFREENARLKGDLENEKCSLLIKNKIIEDQQETIKNLREKLEEMKAIIKQNQSLERTLNIEREEKLELQEAVERLKWRKEELKKRIRSLEGDLLIAPQEVVRDLQKTQIVLHELENQVQIKQKEWELHLQSLIREKEQACSVAEFATKKLMQTTNEYKKQSEAHKRLHRVLAENLAEKEKHLREANEKVSHTQLKQIMVDLHPYVGKYQ